MFDDDDTLMYEPETTAALIFTGGDEEAEEAALEVCGKVYATCCLSEVHRLTIAQKVSSEHRPILPFQAQAALQYQQAKFWIHA